MPSLWTIGAHRLVHALDPAHFSKRLKDTTAEQQAPPVSLEDLCGGLRRNELTELKLGYRESDFLGASSKATAIEKALRVNTSLQSVSIGWRHSNRKALSVVFRALARHAKLRHLQIILNDWIPERVLQLLLVSQAATLQSLDVRATTVLRKTALGRWCCQEENDDKPHYRKNSAACDHNVVSRVLVRHSVRHLQELHLEDCGVTNTQAVLLVDFLKRKKSTINQLSLRSNRQLGATGIAAVCQAPVSQKLDLSLCDMDPVAAAALGPAIAARPTGLGEFLVCGNYRMGTDALLALVQQDCCSKLSALNLSYCDITDSRCVAILQALLQLDPKTTTLQEISLQGSHIAADKAVDCLAQVLQSSLALRVMRLDDPSQRKILSAEQLRTVGTAVQANFCIQELQLDILSMTEMKRIWRDNIDFYLRLNRAGRRVILRDEDSATDSSSATIIQNVGAPLESLPDTDWFDVLERAGNDFCVLYWIVRNSADRF